MIWMFCISGFFAVLLLLYFAVFAVSCDCVNYVQCVKYPVSRLVCCLSLCGCDTTPSAGCCFSIKITLKAASLYLSRGSTPEGTQFQSIAEGAPSIRSVVSPKIGPSAQIEHPWTTAVTPWEKRPVAPGEYWVELIVKGNIGDRNMIKSKSGMVTRNTPFLKHSRYIGRSEGAPGMRPPPPGLHSFIFMQFWGKIRPNNRLRPPPWGLVPPLWELLDLTLR